MGPYLSERITPTVVPETNITTKGKNNRTAVVLPTPLGGDGGVLFVAIDQLQSPPETDGEIAAEFARPFMWGGCTCPSIV